MEDTIIKEDNIIKEIKKKKKRKKERKKERKKTYPVPFALSVKEVCQLQTEHALCNDQIHSEDMYFDLAESTDEMPIVKNSHQRYVTNLNHHHHQSILYSTIPGGSSKRFTTAVHNPFESNTV